MSQMGHNPNPLSALACQLSPAADKPSLMPRPAVCHLRTNALQQTGLRFDTSPSMKIGDFRPPVVADFTKRSVNFARTVLLSLPDPFSQGGSSAGSKMLRVTFCRGGAMPT